MNCDSYLNSMFSEVKQIIYFIVIDLTVKPKLIWSTLKIEWPLKLNVPGKHPRISCSDSEHWGSEALLQRPQREQTQSRDSADSVVNWLDYGTVRYRTLYRYSVLVQPAVVSVLLCVYQTNYGVFTEVKGLK